MKKTLLILGLVVAVGLAVTVRMMFRSPATKVTVPPTATFHPAPAPAAPDITLHEAPDMPPAAPAGPTTVSAPTPPLSTTTVAPQVAAPSKPAKPPKEPLHDPVAREALALVGADPEAEAYWLEAIYDTSLPDQEREDLMEDLNEDGLSDQKRPGPQDVPLIINRLAIIEGVAPYADDFMLRHLQEAYKDLLNLSEIAQGRGRPVQ